MTYIKSLYKTDTVAWSTEQAQLLRDRRWQELDLENLIEEVEELGKSEQRAVRSLLVNLLMHLLKKQYQPDKATKSWDDSINAAGLNIQIKIDESPSLKTHLYESWDKCYQYARKGAANETRLPRETFPDICPENIRDQAERVIFQ